MHSRKSSVPNLTVIAGEEPAKPEDRASTFTRTEEPPHHELEDASPSASLEASKHSSLDGTVIAEVRTSA